MIILKNIKSFVLGDESIQQIEIDDGKISYMGKLREQSGEIVDLKGKTLMPNFVSDNEFKKLKIEQINDFYEKSENEFLEIIKKSKDEDSFLMVRLASSLDEMGECDKLYQKTPIELCEDFGVLDRKTIFLDPVFAEKKDIDLLSMYQSNVLISPSKELEEMLAIAPIEAMKSKLNIGIYANKDYFKEMYLAFTLTRFYTGEKDCVLPEEIIKMATFNVYKLFDEDFQTFVAGSKPFFLVLDKEFSSAEELILNAKKEDVVCEIVANQIRRK